MTHEARLFRSPTLTLVACLAWAVPVSDALAVPQQWIGNGHYYELITDPGQITWEAAKEVAEAMTFMGLAGNLASITSAEENAFVGETIVGADGSAWFGGTQAISGDNSSWKWSDGSTWTFTSWDGVQPDNFLGGTQHTIFLASAPTGAWHDSPSSWAGRPSAYVVEFATPVPEPTALAMLLAGLGVIGGVAHRRFQLTSA